MARDALAQVSDFLQMMERAKEVSGRGTVARAEGELWQPSAVTGVLAGVREAGSPAGWGQAAPDGAGEEVLPSQQQDPHGGAGRGARPAPG